MWINASRIKRRASRSLKNIVNLHAFVTANRANPAAVGGPVSQGPGRESWSFFHKYDFPHNLFKGLTLTHGVVFRDSRRPTVPGFTRHDVSASYRTTVSFDPKWGGPANVRFDELTDWSKHAEDSIKFYSGTAIYRKTFTLSVLSEKSGQLMLDLGEVREVAEVRLNGHNLGVVWTKPARVNITSAVKVGANQLDLSIVNLWPNRLIGDAALAPEKRFTETNMRKFVSSTPLLPSGLLGPVQVLTADVPP